MAEIAELLGGFGNYLHVWWEDWGRFVLIVGFDD